MSPRSLVSGYYDDRRVASRLEKGQHREIVGGLWDEIGQWQFDLMHCQGLLPSHKLLDLGCGSFRGGVKFLRYLDAGNYYGIDRSSALIDAGYEKEIVANGLASVLPRENLSVSEEFAIEAFATTFDFVVAVSLFSHLPLNHIRLGLTKVSRCLKAGGRLVFTYFDCPPGRDIHEPLQHSPGGVVTTSISDPYHYRFADLRHVVSELPVMIEPVAFQQHARNQKPVVMTRI